MNESIKSSIQGKRKLGGTADQRKIGALKRPLFSAEIAVFRLLAHGPAAVKLLTS
jgi:hypothetical protein